MYIKHIFLFSLCIGFIFEGESSSTSGVSNDIPVTTNKIESIKTVDGNHILISSTQNISPTSSSTNANDTSTNTTGTSTTPLVPNSPSSSVTPPTTITSTAKPTPTAQPTTSSPTSSSSTIPPTSPSTTPPTSPSTTPPTSPSTAPSPTSPSTTPTPVPPRSEFWTVTNSTSNITCIVARMNIELEIRHENKSFSLEGNPKISEAKGKCGKDLQTLEILLSKNSTVLFIFNETEETYFISSLSINIALNSSSPVTETKNVSLYETGKNTSYSCPSYMLNLEPDNKTTVKLSMNNIQIEAFRFTNTTQFSHAVQCPNSEVPDIVPLIVGLALAGLVIVVVIGYFIGRRRSQSRGYLSM